MSSIQSTIIPTILQQLGLSSKLSTATRFGPVELGSLGLIDLRTEGGIEMIKVFRNSIFSNSKTGQLLLLNLQASQVESGLPNLLLEEPTLRISNLTPTLANLHSAHEKN